MDMTDVSKRLGDEWAVIAHTPILFFASIIVAMFIFWRFCQWQYGAQLSNIQSTLDLRNAQLQDYKDKLSGATPDEAKARMDALEARIDEIIPQLAALSPRQLGIEQRRAMLPFLEEFRGSRVHMVSDAGSADAAQMLKALVAAFNLAGWHVSNAVGMGFSNSPPSGVAIRVVNPTHPTLQQKAVLEAFKAARLEYDLQSGTPMMIWNQPPIAEILVTNRLLD